MISHIHVILISHVNTWFQTVTGMLQIFSINTESEVSRSFVKMDQSDQSLLSKISRILIK